MPDERGVVEAVASLIAAEQDVPRDDLAQAVRAVTAELAARHPGRTIEVRVPPFAAVQVASVSGEGPTHRRGTPPNLVEFDPTTAIRLASGTLSWDSAVTAGLVRHSGAHAGDVAAMWPLWPDFR